MTFSKNGLRTFYSPYLINVDNILYRKDCLGRDKNNYSTAIMSAFNAQTLK